MRALLTELARDPARTRRRWAAAAGLALVGALSITAFARQRNATASLCHGGPTHLAGVWERVDGSGAVPTRRDAVGRAILASGAPGAREVWDRVAPVLDRYAGAWLSAYEDACEATHVRRAQPASILDLRMTCLEERRISLAALIDVLAKADKDVVANAVGAANALPTLDRCSNLDLLLAPVEPPRDAMTRIAADELRRRGAFAKALADTGKRREALAAVKKLIAEGRALGYAPLLAEMLTLFTQLEPGTSLSKDEIPVAEEAVSVALRAGLDELAAIASVQLVAWTGYVLADPRMGAYWTNLSHALLARQKSPPPLLEAWLVQNEGVLVQSDPHELLTFTNRALSLKEKILPPDHPDIAMSLNALAETWHRLGRDDEALKLAERSMRIFVTAYGPSSPDVSMQLSNHAEYLLGLGRASEAVPEFRTAYENWERQIGANHQFLGYPLTGLGRALLALGRPDEAVAPLEHALRIREASEPDKALVKETREALARARREARDVAQSPRQAR
jgi:tetratricopeptide (TPR) repeat protein